MYKARMRRVIKYLKTVPENKFDISIWGVDTDCGTTACAGGWITQMPEWKKNKRAVLLDYSVLTACTFMPALKYKSGNYTGCRALSRWLGISLDEAESIFYYHGDPKDTNLSDVINKLQLLLDGELSNVKPTTN